MEDNELESYSANPDQLPFIETENEAHPSPEMLLIRLAIDKALFKAQRELWYMHAYDRMTPTEIGRKLKVSEASIRQRIKVIEKKIEVYCKDHYEVYETLKEAENAENQGC